MNTCKSVIGDVPLRELVSSVRAFDAVVPDVPVGADVRLITDMCAKLVEKTGNPKNVIAVGSSAWSSLVVNSEFGRLFDPAVDFKDLTAGFMGTFLGLPVLCEAFVFPEPDLVALSNVIAVANYNYTDAVKVFACVKFRIR